MEKAQRVIDFLGPKEFAFAMSIVVPLIRVLGF